MLKHIQTGLILLTLVALDATGDALRLNGWQVPHHVVESIQIGWWLLIWALYGFKRYYIAMYILARVWAFALVFNLWAGNKLLYLGTNDLVGISIHWFADLVGHNYMHFSFILKFMALVWWVGWLISDGDTRSIFMGKR